MKMNGSWHVYPRAARWRRAAFRAVVVLETGDRIAVGFDIPDLELAAVSRRNADAGAPLRRLDALGPDILQEPPDTAAMVARARSHSEAAITLGELLLDQRVAAGIGNMWRAEALFACRMSPWSPVTSVSDVALHELFETAASLMRASVVGRRPLEQAYGRSARPCRRCGTPIAAKPQGQHARMAYWCPSCQPGDDRRREDDH